MKLYHISQDVHRGYDTFSDMVVCAESEEEARKIHPADWSEDPWKPDPYAYWCDTPDQAKVEYIGEAAEGLEKGVICASFHAG